MKKYKIYCTEAQTAKALGLCALIINHKNAITRDDIPHFIVGEVGKDWTLFICPTAEKMIGWLEDGFFKEIRVQQDTDDNWEYTVYWKDNLDIFGLSNLYPSRKEATLAAIDAALEYLENLKQ